MTCLPLEVSHELLQLWQIHSGVHTGHRLGRRRGRGGGGEGGGGGREGGRERKVEGRGEGGRERRWKGGKKGKSEDIYEKDMENRNGGEVGTQGVGGAERERAVASP